MGLKKTSDGRYVVGLGVTDGNDYKGGIGKRDMVIQYTEDGATEQSLEYLEFLKGYALAHADEGKLIFPEGVSVWLATGDKLQAIEADDIKLTEDTFSVGSVSCSISDGEWTFDTPSAGGSIPTPEAEDDGKVLTAGADGTASWQTPGGGTPSADTSDAWKNMTAKPTYERKAVVPEQTVVLSNGVGTVTGCDFSGLSDGDTAYFHVNFAGSDFYGVYYYTTIIDGEMGFSEYQTWQSGYAYIKADGTVYQPMVAAYPTVSGSCYVEAYVAKSVEASWETGIRILDFSAYAPLVKDVPSTGGGTVPFDSSINTLAFKDTADNIYTPSSVQVIFADEAFKYHAPMIAYSYNSWRLVGDAYESVALSATLLGYYSVTEPTPFYQIEIPIGSGSSSVYYVFPRDTNIEFTPGGES